jgi:F-type H+-transporting ATPase subunit alpha
VRPAINVGISVSRVGGSAQTKPMKRVAGRLRLELSQYRELEAFAQFGSELDADTQATLARGARLVETLKQDELDPWPVENQVAAIYSGTGGYLERIKVERIQDFHEALMQRLASENSDLMQKIAEGEWDDGIESELGDAIAEAIDDFGPDFDEEGNPIEEGESDRIRSEQEREAEGRTAAEDLKGEELDERARDLEIEGRSSMSADEKREAVAEAEGSEESEDEADEGEDEDSAEDKEEAKS